ncbi:MAG: hypothetical protein JWL77_206 [Chthonomonadaceae bacterium]|nr:hypothetical protein [Chthonomonadaceae bacterium]
MFFFAIPTSLGAILSDLIGLLIWAIIIESVVSNVIAFGGKLSPYHPAVKALRAVVNPILTPVRRILPPPARTGGWDLSPLIVIILLSALRNYLFFGL